MLTRLTAAAQERGRLRTLIELEVLQAVAAEAAGQRAVAEQALQRAAALAAPDRWLQVFAAEAEALRRPLDALRDRHPSSPFPNGLLAAVRSD